MSHYFTICVARYADAGKDEDIKKRIFKMKMAMGIKTRMATRMAIQMDMMIKMEIVMADKDNED